MSRFKKRPLSTLDIAVSTDLNFLFFMNSENNVFVTIFWLEESHFSEHSITVLWVK